MFLFEYHYTGAHYTHKSYDRHRGGEYPNTLVNERKHKAFKYIAKDVPAGRSFDRAVLQRMLLNQMRGLQLGDAVHGEMLSGQQEDVTHSLGPCLRPHCLATAILASKEGPHATHACFKCDVAIRFSTATCIIYI